jgi:hypothetical protein
VHDSPEPLPSPILPAARDLSRNSTHALATDYLILYRTVNRRLTLPSHFMNSYRVSVFFLCKPARSISRACGSAWDSSVSACCACTQVLQGLRPQVRGEISRDEFVAFYRNALLDVEDGAFRAGFEKLRGAARQVSAAAAAQMKMQLAQARAREVQPRAWPTPFSPSTPPHSQLLIRTEP